MKILGEAGKQDIYNKCCENSRSQIAFRIDIFQKLTLGAPEKSQAIVAFLNSFQELNLEWLDWVIFVFDVCFCYI